MAIEENLEHGAPESFLGWSTCPWILIGESLDGGTALDPEYIRKRIDEWLDDMLQDELDDKKRKLSQLEGDEYFLAAVESELQVSVCCRNCVQSEGTGQFAVCR
jgi:hypothetical protein